MITELLKPLAELMASADVTARQLIEELGADVTEKDDRGYRVVPVRKDLEVKHARIVVDRGRGADGSPVEYLQFTFEDDTQLTYTHLETVFDVWNELPAPPSGPPVLIASVYDDGKSPFVVPVFAKLSGAADNPATRVRQITLRRDKRR